jgi:hypothetical protein
VDWLRRSAFRRSHFSPRLDKLLQKYPPYKRPFADAPLCGMSTAQAQANLLHLKKSVSHRLRLLKELLQAFGIQLPDDLSAHDPRPLLGHLHEWSCQHWPRIFERRLANVARWRTSKLGPGDAAYSLLADMGLLLGEIIIQRCPEFMWALNDELVDSNLHMQLPRRLVVSRSPKKLRDPSHACIGIPETADVFDWVFLQFWKIGTPGGLSQNRWSKQVMGYLKPSNLRVKNSKNYDCVIDHLKVIESYGLDWSHASHPGLFFLRWIIEQELLNPQLPHTLYRAINAFRQGRNTLAEVYASMDWTLTPQHLSHRGAEFAQTYYHLEQEGPFGADLMYRVSRDAPSAFHVKYTENNYQRFRRVITARFKTWRMPQPQRMAGASAPASSPSLPIYQIFTFRVCE